MYIVCNTNSTIKHLDMSGKGTRVNKFRVPVLMLKIVTFEFYNLKRKIHNENELHYSVLKSSSYQLLDFEIKNEVFYLKKSIS